MTPEEVIALALIDMDEIPEPDTTDGRRFEATCKIANPMFDNILSHGWYLTNAKQAKHVWTEHEGEEVGVPYPFTCFGCAGLFDGVGEYNP